MGRRKTERSAGGARGWLLAACSAALAVAAHGTAGGDAVRLGAHRPAHRRARLGRHRARPARRAADRRRRARRHPARPAPAAHRDRGQRARARAHPAAGRRLAHVRHPRGGHAAHRRCCCCAPTPRSPPPAPRSPGSSAGCRRCARRRRRTAPADTVATQRPGPPGRCCSKCCYARSARAADHPLAPETSTSPPARPSEARRHPPIFRSITHVHQRIQARRRRRRRRRRDRRGHAARQRRRVGPRHRQGPRRDGRAGRLHQDHLPGAERGRQGRHRQARGPAAGRRPADLGPHQADGRLDGQVTMAKLRRAGRGATAPRSPRRSAR